MKNKLLAGLLALFVLLSFAVPSDATVATSRTATSVGDATLIPAAITITAADTTASFNTLSIDNRDGRVEYVSAVLNETAATGTSPTEQLILQGSNDGTNWFNIQSGDATPVDVKSAATSVAAAAVIGLDSAQELRSGGFPAFLRVQVLQGGTTPALTGVLSLMIIRKHVQK